MIGNYFYSTGKRKTSVAKVFLRLGNGNIIVNNKNFSVFHSSIYEVLSAIRFYNFYILIHVYGGGYSSQINSLKVALAKAIIQFDTKYSLVINQVFSLKRDSRIVERKKIAHLKSRKSGQFSKR